MTTQARPEDGNASSVELGYALGSYTFGRVPVVHPPSAVDTTFGTSTFPRLVTASGDLYDSGNVTGEGAPPATVSSDTTLFKDSVDSLAYPIHLPSGRSNGQDATHPYASPNPSSIALASPSSPYKRQRRTTTDQAHGGAQSVSSSYPMLPITMSPIRDGPEDGADSWERWSPPKTGSPSRRRHMAGVPGGSGASERSRRSSKFSAGYPNFMPSMGGVVRSLSRDALSDITLRDVLDGRTCSPISFHDFEGFVSHKEYTAENLLFIVWYRSYCSRFSNLPEEERLKVAIPSTRLQDSDSPFAYLTKKKQDQGTVAATFASGVRRASVWGRRGSAMSSALLNGGRKVGPGTSPELDAGMEKLGPVHEESPVRSAVVRQSVTPITKSTATFNPPSRSPRPPSDANGAVDVFAASPKITGHRPHKVCAWTTEGELACSCENPDHSHDSPHLRGQRLGRGLDIAERHIGTAIRTVQERSRSVSRANSDESLRERYLGKSRRPSAAPSELSAVSIPEEGVNRQGPGVAYLGRRRSSLPMLSNLSTTTTSGLAPDASEAAIPLRLGSPSPAHSSARVSPVIRLDRIPSIPITPMDVSLVDPLSLPGPSAGYVFGQTPLAHPTVPPISSPIAPSGARPPVTFRLSTPPDTQDYVPGVKPEEQPMRQEAQRAYATFLRMGGLRELNVSEETRINTKEALRGSTHPDVFLPIFKEIYGLVETQSLPHFLSYAQSNVNLPKQVFWYIVGITDLAISVLMFLLMVFLLPAHPYRIRAWRVFSVVFATFGAMQTYSAWRGFCTQVWGRASRQMHPWEMDEDEDEADESGGGSGIHSGRINTSANASTGPSARHAVLAESSQTSSTRVGTESFGSTEKDHTGHEDASPAVGVSRFTMTERLVAAPFAAIEPLTKDSWQPDSAWDTALGLDSSDGKAGRAIAPFTDNPEGEPLVPGSGKPLGPALAMRQESHVFRNLLRHLRKDPSAIRHKKPAIFGPEIIILDERVVSIDDLRRLSSAY